MFSPIIFAGGLLIVPVGSLFAGAVFVLRDVIQLRYGKRKTYRLILWAAVLSAVMSLAFGDTAHVAAASVIAFFVSEAADTEVFSKLQKSMTMRVLISGIVGGCLDSALFVILGLSPIGAGVLSWGAVPFAIIGQVLTKTVVQLPAAGYTLLRNKKMKEISKGLRI